MSTALARRPEVIRAEVAADPARRELLQAATAELLTATQAFITSYVALPIPNLTPADQTLPYLAMAQLTRPDQTVPEPPTLPNPVASALALWVLHCWTVDAFDATPYLMLLSSEPGSGKTRCLEVLSYLVPRPWLVANATPTTLFRRMDTDRPTLLLDELDGVFRGGASNEALRQVLNAGNRRGSTISRCDGRWGTREYATFGPKVLCGIDNGFMPSTLLDRSIVIRMTKTHGQVQRLRPRIAAQQAAPIAYTMEQWSLIAVDELACIEPEIPASLSDRQADAWEPLLALAAFGSPEWSEAGRTAANALSGHSTGGIESAGDEMLLPAMAGVLS
jgi:hypothetical protein